MTSCTRKTSNVAFQTLQFEKGRTAIFLALLQKLKIKYELSYQCTTRLKYIDKFNQLLIIHQSMSTVDNTTIVDTFDSKNRFWDENENLGK
jgi:hypothetical protein